ncbi:conjugal transfer protein TraD [Chryseobacterium sp. PBS4-4]|uniref:Conjugal transfer protein TraD n=1 Tax=Chryseobacterium edaphi TaxID=2976532 RepID=A0ABT2W8B7_9FLAO|nr:conjugal transfer protein TraD [Chryseobacterium edaphi]MCU7618457.1 conjugal transfer protein TraD [Chryseobacterium edaphi]
MEILIVLCLLLIITLLLQDKIVTKKRLDKKNKPHLQSHDLPQIMGKPKQVIKHTVFNNPSETPENFNEDFVKNESVKIQIPEEELEVIFAVQPDFEEEEEGWKKYGILVDDQDLATGATFEDLGSASRMLQKEKLQPSEKEVILHHVQRIEGTLLLDLLENSIEKGADKIAELLDSSIASLDTTDDFATFPKVHLKDFDIDQFL